MVPKATRLDNSNFYQYEIVPGLSMNFRGDLFSIGLTTEIVLTNIGEQAITLVNPTVELRDAKEAKQRRFDSVRTCHSQQHGDAETRFLNVGESCRFRTDFWVSPITYFLYKPNPDLCQITVSISGLERELKELALVVRAVWFGLREKPGLDWSCENSSLAR